MNRRWFRVGLGRFRVGLVVALLSLSAGISASELLALLLSYRVAICCGWQLVSASDSGMEIPERPSKGPLQDVDPADATVSPQ